MKAKFKILFFIFLLSLTHCLAQTPELMGPPGSAESIQFHPADNRIIYTYNSPNQIFRRDENNNVGIINTGTGNKHLNFLGLSKKNPAYIYAGYDNYLLISTDSGKTWTAQHEGNYNFITFNPLNSDVIYIIRNFTELCRSDDKGLSWKLLKKFDNRIYNIRIAPTDTSLMFIGSMGILFKSTDSGNQWTEWLTGGGDFISVAVNPFNKNSLYTIYDGWLVKIEAGKIKKQMMKHSSSFILHPADTMVIYAYSGAPDTMGIYKTTDEGNSWTPLITPAGKSGYPAINPDKPEETYISSGSSTYKSLNAGTSWEPVYLCSIAPFDFTVNADNPEEITAVHYSWKVLHRNSGGEWQKPVLSPFESFSPGEYYYPGIEFNPFNPSEGYLCTGTYFYKSADGGSTYNLYAMFSSPIELRYNPYFRGTAFVRCSGDRQYQTTDNGTMWVKLTQKVLNGKTFFHRTNANLLYSYDEYAINDPRLNISTDLGVTWQDKSKGLIRIPNEIVLSPISALAIDNEDPDKLYCGQWHGLSRSTDRGSTWTRIDSALKEISGSTKVSAILRDSAVTGRMFVALDNYGEPQASGYNCGGLFLTEDDGQTWKKIFNAPVSGIYKHTASGYLYLNTDFGIIRMPDTFSVASGVDVNRDENINGFSIAGNYPNPFNPVTKIRYTLPEQSSVQLQIYNITGTLISTQTIDSQPAGTHELIWNGRAENGTECSSGMYIYTLRVRSNINNRIYQKSHKMILLK